MCVLDDFVSFVFVFWSPTFSLVASVGTGGVEGDEREIQERASESTGSLPSYPNTFLYFGLAGSGMRSRVPNKRNLAQMVNSANYGSKIGLPLQNNTRAPEMMRSSELLS